MATSIEIQMTPTWLDRGNDRACYFIERVDVGKYLNGKTFRKTVDEIPYEIKLEKKYISIREDKPILCEFALKISEGKKIPKDRMQKGLKILCELSKEMRKTVIEQQKEHKEWLSQDTLVFCV